MLISLDNLVLDNINKLNQKNMKHSIVFALLISLLFSCSSNDVKVKNEEQQEKKQKEQESKIKWKNLNNLATNFGAVVGFDTLHFSLSYEYQNFLRKNNKIILDDFVIDDIVNKDSSYVVSIHTGYLPTLFFELTCDANQARELLPDPLPRYHIFFNSDKIIIVSITSIKKIKFKIDTEVENPSEDEEPRIHLELNSSDDFILKGKLINISKN